MAIELADTLVNARADLITAARDAGASGGHIRIYDGTRPAKGGTATTLLGELTFLPTSAPSASGGVLTASAITGDTSADATGTATWFREVDSDGLFVLDGDCGLAGSDLNFNDVNVVITLPINISSYVVTDGNF
jgi:hypothetical protein